MRITLLSSRNVENEKASLAWPMFMVLALLFFAAGCQKTIRTSDPQLKPIQDMLDEQLPPGTPDSKVLSFLDVRGYKVEGAVKPGTIVAIIRHIDATTVTPVTARVTFYFDDSRHLKTFELERTINEPIPSTSN